MKAKLTSLVRLAVDRAEALKGVKTTKPETAIPNLPSVPETALPDEATCVNTTPSTPGRFFLLINEYYLFWLHICIVKKAN